jgi:C4-dicarboxylate-specific signal transduction histidine kinase
MRSYRDFSIKTKLSLLVLLAGGVALALATTCFVINDVSMIRSSTVQVMRSLAEVLGSNSTAAIEFQDEERASELLSSLRQQPSVAFACLYDAAGKPFASYHRSEGDFTFPALPSKYGVRFDDDGHLDVVELIARGDQHVGAIYLHASMDELRQQMMRYLGIVAGMLIVSLGASLALSSRFQRHISAPILKLAETAQRVSQRRDFGIRVLKTANDELGTLYDKFNEMLEQIERGEAAIQKARDELEIKVVERTAELSRANRELSREISVRVQAEMELEKTHDKLVDAARRAGMAEIATGVLHNVGNVLNSVNVSATLVADRVRQSKVSDLSRAVKLIEEHASDLGAFVASDAKGKHLPEFLRLLATHLSDERLDIGRELEQLMTKVEHIKAIVATQQSYAGVSGVIEAVDLSTMLDDALRLNATAFERHRIKVIKQYSPLPRILVDKQKVLQIVINLVKNAKEAFHDCLGQTDRQVIVRTGLRDKEILRIQIIDNGIGIAADDLTRIFSHGFTTKNTGHGFGLHSCANAANEMGGALTVHSKGRGLGATFTLELPFEPAEKPIRA